MTPQAGRVAVEHSGLTRIDSSFGQSKGLDSNVAFLQRVRSKKVWKMELCNDIQYVFTVDVKYTFCTYLSSTQIHMIYSKNKAV